MRPERIQLIQDVTGMMGNSEYVYLISFQGLKVAQFAELRKQLSAVNSECHVIKNTFVIKAAEQLGLTELANVELGGDTAIVVGTGDRYGIAKVLKDAAKTTKIIAFKMAHFDGKIWTPAELDAVAELPSLDTLRA
ncbi:MAG: 50S ribosomal protein L10, partial [Lentisphaeria bacterium]